ncbi:MAG: hypothetical protein J6386_06555 [Candidatus Synoicihabitans palmerolidicus]|nr:hypothetical protein [Candidatus Synoicihabitans palmerolidicus]
MSLSGEILDLRWVSGFENPKGLAVANGRLYVGDDDGMVEIDLESATIVSRHVPPDGGSAGFNDCTADPDGNIYVFCSRLGAIFRLHGGEFSSWVEFDLSQTPGPNGLRAEAERLLLGGWSFRGADGESEVGHIATIRYADKAASRLGSSPVCHIDGLEPDGFGGYTVTDWATGDVLHVTAEGAATPIMKLNQGTADHEYLIEKGLLIIPLMKDDTVRAYAWAPQRRLR